MTADAINEPAHGDPHDHEHAHGDTGKYIAVFAALCVLTGASFFTCSDLWPFKDTPSIGWAFMMAVSCTKAMLVILFFMHLIWEANWKYVLTIPAAMMSVFLVCMLIPDVGLRTRRYSEERRMFAAEAPAETAGDHGGAAHGDDHGHDESGGTHADGH
ncbi:MAG: cytochrome C oxidase subunit IV family protein [Planctomycetota bacterium]